MISKFESILSINKGKTGQFSKRYLIKKFRRIGFLPNRKFFAVFLWPRQTQSNLNISSIRLIYICCCWFHYPGRVNNNNNKKITEENIIKKIKKNSSQKSDSFMFYVAV